MSGFLFDQQMWDEITNLASRQSISSNINIQRLWETIKISRASLFVSDSSSSNVKYLDYNYLNSLFEIDHGINGNYQPGKLSKRYINFYNKTLRRLQNSNADFFTQGIFKFQVRDKIFKNPTRTYPQRKNNLQI